MRVQVQERVGVRVQLHISLTRSVPKPLKVPSLARSVPKPLKVPSLARSVPKPLKVPSLARSVRKPLKVGQEGGGGGCHETLLLECHETLLLECPSLFSSCLVADSLPPGVCERSEPSCESESEK